MFDDTSSPTWRYTLVCQKASTLPGATSTFTGVSPDRVQDLGQIVSVEGDEIADLGALEVGHDDVVARPRFECEPLAGRHDAVPYRVSPLRRALAMDAPGGHSGLLRIAMAPARRARPSA